MDLCWWWLFYYQACSSQTNNKRLFSFTGIRSSQSVTYKLRLKYCGYLFVFLDFRLQIRISPFKPKFHNFLPPCGNHTSHDPAISFRSCSCSFVWITLLSCLDYHVRFFWLYATKQVEHLSVPYLLYCSIKTLTEQLHMGMHGKYNYNCACEWIMLRKKAKQPLLYLWFLFFNLSFSRVLFKCFIQVVEWKFCLYSHIPK